MCRVMKGLQIYCDCAFPAPLRGVHKHLQTRYEIQNIYTPLHT